MQMVFDFEQAAYSLNPGEVSQPVRTRFGYHLIKLHDIRPSQGKIQISHILVRTNPGISSGDSTMAAQKAREVYRLAAEEGEDWIKLCRQFSEDLSTSQKGGVLPWIKMGDVANIPSFQNAAFALKEVGSLSEPVKTEYGWHIIRLENKQELEPFEELEPRIKSNLSRNSRGDLNRKALVNRLRKENQVKEYPEVLSGLTVYANDSLGLGNWEAPKNLKQQNDPILSIEAKSYSVNDFLNFIVSNQPIRMGQTAAQKFNHAYGQFVENNLIEYEKENLSEKYPEYRMLYQEYREGLLLFQLMEDKVWNKAVEDTTGLSNFFNQHQDRYQWEQRVDAEIYSAASKEILTKVKSFLDKGSFEYQKYDFSGSEQTLNRAQIRILDQIGRNLLQGSQRYLVLNYPGTASGKQIRDLLMTHLTNYKVHSRVKESEWDNPGILAYIESTSVKDLQEYLNQRETLALEVQTGRFSRGENDQIDGVSWEPGTYESQQDDREVLVHIKEVLPAGNQLLNEVRGLAISDYQEELEKQWVQQLKGKYNVVVNEKAVSNVISGYEN
jgi:peptidyl-prolyl cis-trans isomerase SurA